MPLIHLHDYAVSPNVAAAILGHSDKHVRHLIADGVLPASEGNRPKVRLADLADFRGREISFEEFAGAFVQVQRQRDRWAAYQRERRVEGKSGGTVRA